MIARNIELEKKLVDKLVSAVNFNDLEATGTALTAIAALIKATGDESYVGAITKLADGAMEECSLSDSEALANYELGRGLYAAADVTKNERYAKKAKDIAGQLGTQPRYEDGLFKGSKDNGVKRPCRSYMYAPFYMSYETRDGGKERYNDIIAQMRTYRTGVYKDFAAGLDGDGNNLNVISHFAAAQIDTMEVMDQMLYEIYHEMMDYYRDAIDAVVKAHAYGCAGTKADFVFGYAVLKGCRMKALHTEKYEPLVIGLTGKIDTDVALSAGVSQKDADTLEKERDSAYVLAFKMMFYSETIRNREYQDYGRGKGGALWS